MHILRRKAFGMGFFVERVVDIFGHGRGRSGGICRDGGGYEEQLYGGAYWSVEQWGRHHFGGDDSIGDGVVGDGGGADVCAL